MIYDKKIAGTNIVLQAVEESDAQFIIDIRTEPNNCKYINKTNTNLSNQQEWIKQQQTRANDYYFIIKAEGKSVGTISLYNIDIKKKEAEFGRWICPNNSLYAVESAMLLYDLAFYVFNLQRIYTLTVQENKKVVNFHAKIGASFVADRKHDKFILSEQEVYKEIYESIRSNLLMIIKILGGEKTK
jgi:RimJ/RimL family protein N-acetyltransferase